MKCTTKGCAFFGKELHTHEMSKSGNLDLCAMCKQPAAQPSKAPAPAPAPAPVAEEGEED